ncbi:MAG: hypothetical protein AB2792_23005, partial [Candidatus Thiodiazotropha sp.]
WYCDTCGQNFEDDDPHPGCPRSLQKLPSDPGGSIPKYPWKDGPLNAWSIVGMNHYHVAGERFLFVSMTKDGKCITAEGKDDKYLWNRLCHAAWKAEEN